MEASRAAQKMGWSGIKNGQLLKLAVDNGFDVFLTGDRNLSTKSGQGQ